MRKLFTVSLLAYALAMFGQDPGGNPRKFNFECLEGDTLIDNPYCHFCPPGDTVIFYGLKVTSPSFRITYIRHKYQVDSLGSQYISITYDVDSLLFVPLSATYFKSVTEAVDSLRSCPTAPIDSMCCRDTIDLFELVGDTLRISISDEDSVYYVVLDIPPGGGDGDCCCNDCSFTVMREYFPGMSTDSVTVTFNGGELPGDTAKVFVYVEGEKKRYGAAGYLDYYLDGPTVRFNYTLEGEDVEVLALIDTLTNNPIDASTEFFAGVSASSVAAAGQLPSNPYWIKVFVEGDEKEPMRDYFVNGSSVEFNYTLEGEDVEVWYLSDVDCDLLIFREWFADRNTAQITITSNQGNFPALDQSVFLTVEGLKQQDGPAGDYELSGSNANFAYTLESEDVSTWFIIGGVDVGFLGAFRN